MANRVGRLIELTVETPVSVDEANRAFVDTRNLVQGLRTKVVTACDLMGADIFAPEVSDKLTHLMRSDNPHVERSAYLVSDAPTFSLQFMRMIREAGNPARRIFRRRAEMESWLAPVLTLDERERLHTFLDERGVARLGFRV
ncbi:hypothetical protein LVJ94_15930 [Pendulispora rubella]|uniref:Uncharacterized protein n=1 Tax=Pendulispora rubella TaxID=2741070 RepID=A0ABZ2LCR1_9BACT